MSFEQDRVNLLNDQGVSRPEVPASPSLHVAAHGRVTSDFAAHLTNGTNDQATSASEE
jgi:hypothetical protein